MCRRLANLTDAARRRLELQREHGLDGVDDDERRLEAGNLLENPLEAGLGEQEERRAAHAEPLTARLDLMFRLLTRAVQHRSDGPRHVGRGLQQQRRLTDARLASEEHQRSGHDATAQHAIELANPGREPRVLLNLDLGVESGDAWGARSCVSMRAAPGTGVDRPLLDERVPRAAVRTTSEPLRGLCPALLAHENGPGRFGHDQS